MATPKLTLYVDVVSPFNYLAFHLIRTSTVFRGCELNYVPVFLGGIMKACGNKPPITVKNKSEWTDQDRVRWARYFGIPMADQLPEGFPRSTLAVQRALVALTLVKPEKLPDVIAALYHASFVERKRVHTSDYFLSILSAEIGGDCAKEVLTKSTTPEVKTLLSTGTDQALAEGAFGMPWFAAVNAQGVKECFWGFDHIGMVADHLGLEKPSGRSSSEAGWKAML